MRALKFHAIVLTALALVPGGAHFFSLPNKITLTESNYFIVQNIYRGWGLFGIVLFGAHSSPIWRSPGPCAGSAPLCLC